jgi:hypothetical protein
LFVSVDGIREVMRRTPLRPFTVRMTSGTRVEVPHPDFAALTPSGRRLVVTHDDDSIEILDTLMIESIEHPADSSNGS